MQKYDVIFEKLVCGVKMVRGWEWLVWGSNIWEIGSGGKDCLLKFLVGGQNLGKLVGVKSLVWGGEGKVIDGDVTWQTWLQF